MYKNWYYGYIKTLGGYHFDKGIPESVKELLFCIEALVVEIIIGYLHIKTDAHVARFYQRAYLLRSVEPDAFRYHVELGARDHLAWMLQMSSEILELQTKSWSRFYWRENDVLFNGRASKLCARMRALVSLIKANSRDIQSLLSDAFFFGVLSGGCSQTAQLRRSQAAALRPFWKLVNGMSGISRYLRETTSHMERTPTTYLLRFCQEWDFAKRQLLCDLDFFCVANWTCNTRRLSSRTVFQGPPSQAEPPLSPVIYTVPAGYPRGPCWNYNDYKGQHGETVALCYCPELSSFDSVVTELKHNGVVAIDVQWVKDIDHGDGQRRFLPRRKLSVITLLTESQIAIYHLARMGLDHADIRSSLKILLENPRIVKVGVNIKELQTRFERSLGMRGTCDVASLNAALQVVSSVAPTKPQRTGDLSMLVKLHFDLELPRPPNQSDIWLRDLSLSCLQGKNIPMTVKP
jgi:hypothetical protein